MNDHSSGKAILANRAARSIHKPVSLFFSQYEGSAMGLTGGQGTNKVNATGTNARFFRATSRESVQEQQVADRLWESGVNARFFRVSVSDSEPGQRVMPKRWMEWIRSPGPAPGWAALVSTVRLILIWLAGTRTSV